MSRSIFHEGGPLNIRQTSRDKFHATITLEPDADGMLARSCADDNCAPGYFKVKPGTGITTGQELAYCPYCSKSATPNDFATKQQIEYAKAVLLEEARHGVHRMLRQKLGLDSSGRRKLASGLISIEMRLDPIRRNVINRPIEEELRRDVICPRCGLIHAVFGLAFTCPDCGQDIFLTHVREELSVVSRILDAAPSRAAALGPRIAARDIENALEDVVSIFEAVMKTITRKALVANGTSSGEVEVLIQKQVKNKYQSTLSADAIYESLIGGKLFEPLSEAERQALTATFEKRHPITHNLGIIDRKYLERIAAGALQGRDVRVTAEEIKQAVDLVDRIVSACWQRMNGAAMPPQISKPAIIDSVDTSTVLNKGELSPAAAAITEYLVKHSDCGQDRDPTISLAALRGHLNIDNDALMQGAEELKDMDWLHVDDQHIGAEGCCVAPTPQLFEACDSRWLGWDVLADAVTLARYVLESGSDADTTNERIASQLGWTPRRMNPALALLIERGVVLASECYAHPYITHWIQSNDMTAGFVEQSSKPQPDRLSSRLKRLSRHSPTCKTIFAQERNNLPSKEL